MLLSVIYIESYQCCQPESSSFADAYWKPIISNREGSTQVIMNVNQNSAEFCCGQAGWFERALYELVILGAESTLNIYSETNLQITNPL